MTWLGIHVLLSLGMCMIIIFVITNIMSAKANSIVLAIFFTVLLYAPLGMRAYSVCQEQNINSDSGDKRALHVFVRFMRVAYLRQILAASTRYTPCRTFVLVQILSEKKRKHNTTLTIWMGCGIFCVFLFGYM